ncbi:MAG: aminotransferase class V-fold PLP-dependent enzyme [bacterium]
MIKLIKSSFYQGDIIRKKLAEFILSSDMFSMGHYCQLFEKNFAAKQGREYAVFVSSGSMANLILVQSFLNAGYLKKGDRVGVSALTWSTNIMPLIQLGLEPVLLDCELHNLNVSKNILAKTHEEVPLKALFITNALGFCADLDEIGKYCQENNILLLEDNCESLGSKMAGKLLGNFGVASTFSTYIGHHLSTIEGGVVCTDNKEIYEMLLQVRAHGWDRNLPIESQNRLHKQHDITDFKSKYTFYDLAYNGRPTEINGFIGNIQLQYWDEIVDKRSRNFMSFQQLSLENQDLLPLDVSHMDLVSNFAMPLVFKTHDLSEKYKSNFQEEGVEIRPVIAGNIGNQPFFEKYVEHTYPCPNADLIEQQGFYFGNNPEMTEQEIEALCNLISWR